MNPSRQQNSLSTRYGAIPIAGFVERFAGGGVMSCTPAGAVTLDTPYGRLTPQFTTDDLRRRTVQSSRSTPRARCARCRWNSPPSSRRPPDR